MNKKILCVLAAALAIPGVAQANESGFLVGAGFNFLTVKPDGGQDFDNTILELKGGYKVNPYFMVDARYGFSIKDESFSESSEGFIGGYDRSVSYFGIYGTGIIPIAESFNLYGSLGLAKTKIGVDYSSSYDCGASQPCKNSGSDSESSNSIALALGASYFITNNFSVNAEYGLVHFGEFSDSDTDASIGGFTLSGSYFF